MISRLKAYKFRFYPTAAQRYQLAVEFGNARFVWNRCLDLRSKAWEERQERHNYASLGLSDVVVEQALPPGFDASGSTDEFIQRLPEADAWFRERVAAAKAEGKVLRYVGSIENGQCKVAIKEVDENDPLFKVKDGENALAFFSTYYQPIPLVLRGYGAGTEVTAAGVFADLLRTLNWKQEV
jgi:aspartokinase/homoserine dehydrogenase 1